MMSAKVEAVRKLFDLFLLLVPMVSSWWHMQTACVRPPPLPPPRASTWASATATAREWERVCVVPSLVGFSLLPAGHGRLGIARQPERHGCGRD